MNITYQSAIFNTFHDGGFLFLRRNKRDIDFQIEIQYLASIIDPTYTYFQGTLINCHQCAFEPWGKEKARYEDIDSINTAIIDMEISNARVEDNRLYIHCLGDQQTIGGSLSVSCDSIAIFDEGGKEILVDELLELARRYWKQYE
jgi:hypothetical protein